MTLVELMVTVLVMGIISAMSLAVFQSGSQTVGRVDDDVRGQGDLKIVTETLSRDLRAARGVDADVLAIPATAPDYVPTYKKRLKIWIDSDADYIKDPAEIITWQLGGTVDEDGHYDVRRLKGATGVQIVGRSLVSNIAFAYDNVAPSTTSPGVLKAKVVSVTMTYDAIVGAYLQQKQTTFRVRLRNFA